MKITVLTEELNKALNLVSRVVSVKPSLPVLANVLLKASKTKLELVATNLETSVKLTVSAKIEEEGETTLPAKIFSELVNTTKEEKLDLTLNKENLEIKGTNLKASLATISALEYPPFLDKTKGEKQTVPTQLILEALGQVVFASSVDEGRPILTGVLLRGEKENSLLVATDGFRLAKKEIALNYEGPDLIVPARSFQEVTRFAQEAAVPDLQMALLTENNQIFFGSEKFELTSRLLEGSFPKFEQIIPEKFVSSVKLSKGVLVDQIKQTAVLARDLGNVVQIDIDKQKGMFLQAKTAQIGAVSTKLDTKVDGDALKIAFNARYLLDGLAVIPEEIVTLSFSGPTSPAMVSGDKDDSFTYIVMPVRIQN